MYTIYTIPGACSTAIVILLEKLQVPYTAIKREDVPDYADFVPTNQVPALKTEDGQIITEGGAIILYLLEKHQSPMLPVDLAKKAEFIRWLMFDVATLHPAYGRMFVLKYRISADDGVKDGVLRQFAENVATLWGILDRELGKKRFITGDQPTAIDYLAAVYSSWGRSFPDIPISLGANVQRMINEVSALPEFQAGYKKELIEFHKTF